MYCLSRVMPVSSISSSDLSSKRLSKQAERKEKNDLYVVESVHKKKTPWKRLWDCQTFKLED